MDIAFMCRGDTKTAHVIFVIFIIITKCDNFGLSLSSTLGQGSLPMTLGEDGEEVKDNCT
jgi:hypothetical protein